MNTPELPDEVLAFRLGGYPCGSTIKRGLTLGRSIYSQHVQDQEIEDSEPLSGESRDLE